MKIVYIANSRFPSEKAQSDQVMQMCSSFAILGHEVTLCVPNRKGAVAEDPFVYYDLPRNFAIVRLPCLDWTSYSWMRSFGFWVQTWTFVFSVNYYIARSAPAVVYSRDVFALFKRWKGVLSVWESHAVPRSWFGRWLAKRVHLIVTLTIASVEQFKRAGLSSDRVIVESDAVNPTMFVNVPSREEARCRLKLVDGEHLAIYVGKFTTMGMPKGLDEAIQAVRMLRAEGRAIRLLAVGGTSEELKQYAEQVGDGVELLGHQPQNALSSFYIAADFALMPFPYTEHYAFFMSPLKLFEYLMSGLPIVASDLPSVREILSEREAWLVKPGSVSSLRQAIVEVMDNPDEACARSQRSRALADKYTWSARAGRIVAALERARSFNRV